MYVMATYVMALFVKSVYDIMWSLVTIYVMPMYINPRTQTPTITVLVVLVHVGLILKNWSAMPGVSVTVSNTRVCTLQVLMLYL